MRKQHVINAGCIGRISGAHLLKKITTFAWKFSVNMVKIVIFWELPQYAVVAVLVN